MIPHLKLYIQATRELVRSKDDIIVYHTAKKNLYFAELDDYVHSFYGVGGSLHNFFSKQVDEINLGSVSLRKVKLDFGVIDPL